MTLLGILASGGGGTATPPTPAADPRPVVDDPIVMAMRPDGRRIGLIRLAHDGSGDVTTLGAACLQAKAIQDAKMAAEGLQWHQITPNYRVDILVSPGFYNDPRGIGQSRFLAFYATDPTRGSTSINSGLNPASIYWEGIDILTEETGGYEPKYPVHLSARDTNIFTRCTMRNGNSTSGGGTSTIGTDGTDGGTVVVHDVTLEGGTNQHGQPDMTIPMTLVYSRVTSLSGGVNYGGHGDTSGSEVWVVGCNVGVVDVGATNGYLHLDPATIVGAGGVTTHGNTITDSRTDWPVPTGGLSARDREKYGM